MSLELFSLAYMYSIRSHRHTSALPGVQAMNKMIFLVQFRYVYIEFNIIPNTQQDI